MRANSKVTNFLFLQFLFLFQFFFFFFCFVLMQARGSSNLWLFVCREGSLMESGMLRKETSEIITSNIWPNSTMPTKTYHEMPSLHVFLSTFRDSDSTISLGVCSKPSVSTTWSSFIVPAVTWRLRNPKVRCEAVTPQQCWVHWRMKWLSCWAGLDATAPQDAPGMPLCLAVRQIFLLVVVLDCLAFVTVLSKTLVNYWEHGDSCSVSLCLHCWVCVYFGCSSVLAEIRNTGTEAIL